MTKVHAPYHFVPLSKWVYMPDWAHLVSHDVPFKDGYSGTIEYTLTNVTPLCVGGISDKSHKPTLVRWNTDPFGYPIIPSSSLKGMLRSVLEIASFAKFNCVDNSHFSFRDISSSKTRYSKELKETNAQAYWIKFDNKIGDWTFRKARHTVLFHKDLNDGTDYNIQDLGKKGHINAEEHYKKYPLTTPAIKFDIINKEITGTKGKKIEIQCATNLRNENGNLKGYPVFSSFRPGHSGKNTERLNFSYIFYEEAEEITPIINGKELVNKLFNNHREELVDELKKNPHPTLGLPVFARESTQGKILALGFAKMPRKLYELSTHEVICNTQKLSQSPNTFDLTELMFGTLREHGFSLKSRISFSDARCSKKAKLNISPPMILSNPKSSYLKAYIEQNENDKQLKQNENDKQLKQYERGAKVKGWKRYPSQIEFNTDDSNNLKDVLNVQSKMEFILPENKFKGKIVFHNLKKVELGALLWAMLFKDMQGSKYQHSLGHGKPFGAGAVNFKSLKLTATANSNNNEISIEECTSLFIEHMNKVYPNNSENGWLKSTQIKHLFAFSDRDNNQNKNLTYMPLKDNLNISYTSKSPKTLPNWRHKNEMLTRNESIEQDVPTSFGKGRLNDLIKASGPKSLSEFEKELIRNNLPKHELLFIQLKERLNYPEIKGSKEGRSTCNTQILELIDFCLKGDFDASFIDELLDLCKDKKRTAYLDLAKNKKNKDKLKDRKCKLDTLAKKFNI